MRLSLLAALLGTSCMAQPYAAADALLADSLGAIGGRAVLLVTGPEGVRHVRAFGPITDDTAVPIASATKWLSAAVVMGAVDRGEIALDTPVGQHFPDAPAAVRPATLRQLFSHTAGIRAQPPCVHDRETTLSACAESILAEPLLAAPGRAFVYGSGSMQVAGALVERATGQTWANLFETRVAGPLGMARTTYGETGNPHVGGGSGSTARDYGAFLQMLLLGGVAPPGTPAAGQRVLSQAAVDALFADQRGGAAVVYSPFSGLVGTDPDLPAEPGYGVGMWREQTGAGGALLRASSPGAFGFAPWIDVPDRTAGVLLTLGSFLGVAPTYLELQRRVAAVPVGAAAPVPPRAGATLEAPNPVGRAARVAFTLPAAAEARLTLVDALGRTAAVLAEGPHAAGRHTARLDARGLAAGTYVLVLRAGGEVAARRAVTVR